MVGLDAVTKFHGFGGGGHAPNGSSGVEVVSDEAGIEPLPAAPFVAHLHDISDQNVIVDLGIAASGRRMAGHRPCEAVGRRAHLRTPSSPALLPDDLVEVRKRRVPLRIEQQVHVFCLADDAELGDRFVRTDDDLHPRPHAVHEAFAALWVACPPGPNMARHSSRETSPSKAREAAPAPPHTMGVSPREA